MQPVASIILPVYHNGGIPGKSLKSVLGQTFRDIELAKQVLIGRLKNIYHTRISYPELQKSEEEETTESVAEEK